MLRHLSEKGSTVGKPGFLGVVPMSLNSGTTTLGPPTDILPVPPAALVARPGTEILQVPPAALVARPVTDILPVPSSADLAAAAATSSRPGIPVTAFTAVQVSVPIVATSLPDQPAEVKLFFEGQKGHQMRIMPPTKHILKRRKRPDFRDAPHLKNAILTTWNRHILHGQSLNFLKHAKITLITL